MTSLIASGEDNSEASLERMLAGLNSDDPEKRYSAALELGELGDQRAVEQLIFSLRDPVWIVRSYSAQALCKLNDPRAIEPLKIALDNTYERFNYWAAVALGKLNQDVGFVRLIELLYSDEEVRIRSEACTGYLHHPS